MPERTVFEAVRDFLIDEGLQVVSGDSTETIGAAFDGRNGQWGCFAKVRESEGIVVFYSVFPATVPAERRSEVAQIVNDLNWGMPIGNFELDVHTGELRFRTTVAVDDPPPSPSVLRPAINSNVVIMDNYFERLSNALR